MADIAIPPLVTAAARCDLGRPAGNTPQRGRQSPRRANVAIDHLTAVARAPQHAPYLQGHDSRGALSRDRATSGSTACQDARR
ncbi:MAG TPA: hypothetical protein VKG25_23470, partial [Bryobacteraceae bacterium]|nr:hypothetical protein [Bryobacteraceae bacterium]